MLRMNQTVITKHGQGKVITLPSTQSTETYVVLVDGKGYQLPRQQLTVATENPRGDLPGVANGGEA